MNVVDEAMRMGISSSRVYMRGRMETCLISAQPQAGEKICLLLNIPSPFNSCCSLNLAFLCITHSCPSGLRANLFK